MAKLCVCTLLMWQSHASTVEDVEGLGLLQVQAGKKLNKTEVEFWELETSTGPLACHNHYTGWNDDGDGNLHYFDRHSVSCPVGTGMQQWMVQRSGSNWRVVFRCCAVPDGFVSCHHQQTSPSNDGGGDLRYLDRHALACPANNAMTRWHMLRSGGSDMYIQYTCCAAPEAVTGACGERRTPDNNDGSGNAIYLDRHNPSCDSDQLMTQWRMLRSGGSNIFIQYMCCSVQEPTTTPPPPPPTTTTTTTTSTTMTTSTTTPTTTEAEVVEAVADPHMSNLHGQKFDLFQPGHHVLLTVPRGASEYEAKLFVSAETERIGDRENDLWIRKLDVQGSWVGDRLTFETTDGEFNSAETQRVQKLGQGYTTPEIMAQLVPTLEVLETTQDAIAPTQEFGNAFSKHVRLHMGPVQANVKFATAFKNGRPVNHLDFRAYGLNSVKADIGGELADEATTASLFAFDEA